MAAELGRLPEVMAVNSALKGALAAAERQVGWDGRFLWAWSWLRQTAAWCVFRGARAFGRGAPSQGLPPSEWISALRVDVLKLFQSQ
jgi:hypothetical protein